MNISDVMSHHQSEKTGTTLERVLLICGILASLLYICTDIVAATMLYPGYSYTSQQVSELSAIGAPTRPLWVAMSSVYAPLVIAFGIGVLISAGPKRSLRVTGSLLVAFGAISLLWVLFAPMHMRGTVALASGSVTDSMHLVFAGVQILVMVLFIAFGAVALGRAFRLYSVGTIVAMLVAGAVVSTQAAAIAAGQPTPWMGLVERVSVYSPMLWVAVLAITLLRAPVPRPNITSIEVVIPSDFHLIAARYSIKEGYRYVSCHQPQSNC